MVKQILCLQGVSLSYIFSKIVHIHIHSFNTSIRPAFLAVAPQDTIIISDGKDGGVTVMDYHAKRVKIYNREYKHTKY